MREDRGIRLSISVTTRAKRPSEINGVHYIFIESVAEFVTPLLDERNIAYELFFNTESVDPDALTAVQIPTSTVVALGWANFIDEEKPPLFFADEASRVAGLADAAEGRYAWQADDLTEWQKQELDRRLDDLEKNPDAGSTLEEVFARIRRAK